MNINLLAIRSLIDEASLVENMNIRNAITLFVKCINMQGIIDWVL